MIIAAVPRILVESISLLIILIVTILLKNTGFSSSSLLSKVGLFAVASQRYCLLFNSFIQVGQLYLDILLN